MCVPVADQNQFERVREAISVHMSIFSIGAQHRSVPAVTPVFIFVESNWKSNVVLLASDGIHHDNFALKLVDQDGKPVPAALEVPSLMVGYADV